MSSGLGALGARGALGQAFSGPPRPAPTVIDRVVGIATGVTSRLPGPLAPLGTQTLQSIGNTVDGVGPSPPRARLP